MRFQSKAVLCLMTVAACNTSQAPPPTTTDVVVSEAALQSNDAAWTFVVVDPVNTATLFPTAPAMFNPGQAATEAAAGAAADFSPPGCVNATATGAVVTYVFTDCMQGPLSLKSISGTVTATYAAVTSGPEVSIASSNLDVNGVSVNLEATGTIAVSGTMRTVTLTSRTTTSGMDIKSRNFTETITWTQSMQCVTVSGTGTQAATGTTTNVTITNTTQCSQQCPTSGTVAGTGPSVTSTLTFNGTATAPVTESNGTASNVTLSCP